MTPEETGPALRILLIDDDSVMLELLSALFGHGGHPVIAAHSGDAALPLLKDSRGQLDVILSDLQMPGLHGRALIAALAETRDPATLLIGMSGSQPAAAQTELLDAFLKKPFTMAEFDEAVHLARAHRQASLHASMPGSKVEDSAHASRDRNPGSLPNVPAGTSVAEPASRPNVLDLSIFESLRRTLGPETLRHLYQLTIDDTGQRLDRMEASAGAGDTAAVRREAHAIRGSCGMVGASELHRLAADTEGGSPGDTPAIADFRSACDRLQRMLDETFAI